MDSGQQDNSLLDGNSNQTPISNLNQSMGLPQVQPTTTPQSVNSSNSSSPVQASPSSPTVAEDVDLIEKEWVNKAKKIVESTRNDPSQQNIQLNKFKADYLKIRFNKDIKPMDG